MLLRLMYAEEARLGGGGVMAGVVVCLECLLGSSVVLSSIGCCKRLAHETVMPTYDIVVELSTQVGLRKFTK